MKEGIQRGREVKGKEEKKDWQDVGLSDAGLTIRKGVYKMRTLQL